MARQGAKPPGSDTAGESSGARVPTVTRRAFALAAHGAGKYLWPFRITEALNLQKAIVPVLLAHYMIQSFTGLMFPTAEEYLAKNDIDPAAAATLSDRTIRVRERDFWGTLHALNDFPTLVGAIQTSLSLLLPPVQAYAMPPLPLGSWVQDNLLLDECYVMLPKRGVTARQAISALTGIPEKQIENAPLTDREARLAIAFHEFRHCHRGNALDYTVEREADADVYGMWAAGEVLHNKNIADVFFHARALAAMAHDHDNVLYVDARRRGTVQPSAEDMIGASEDAFALLAAYYNAHPEEKPEEPKEKSMFNRLSGPDKEEAAGDAVYIKNTAAFRKILAEETGRNTGLLSPLARRRIELYIEAAEYFAPSLVGAVKKAPAAVVSAPVPAPVS